MQDAQLDLLELITVEENESILRGSIQLHAELEQFFHKLEMCFPTIFRRQLYRSTKLVKEELFSCVTECYKTGSLYIVHQQKF